MARSKKPTKATRSSKRNSRGSISKARQAFSILDLPLPNPPPEGWEWIEVYRHWARGGRVVQQFREVIMK